MKTDGSVRVLRIGTLWLERVEGDAFEGTL